MNVAQANDLRMVGNDTIIAKRNKTYSWIAWSIIAVFSFEL